MIDEAREEQAALYAMGRLDPGEFAAFENALQTDPELRALVVELEEVAASLAHAAPLHLPPPELKARVLAQALGETPPLARVPAAPLFARWREMLPWAVAAMFALSSAIFWMERRQLAAERGMVLRDLVALEEKSANESAAVRSELATLKERRVTELAGLQAELAALRERDALSSLKIATLSAQVNAYANALAVVVWDAKAQQGVLTLEKFPPAGAGRDYQLWVMDPAKKVPVSAGIVAVGVNGGARTAFKPAQAIGVADKFAISVERAGGAPAPQGPIVVLGK